MMLLPPELPRYLDVTVAPPTAEAPPLAASQPRYVVQVGAYRTRQKAEDVLRAWSALPDPPPMRIAAARVRQGVWFRILAGPVSQAQALALCTRATDQGDACSARSLLLPGATDALPPPPPPPGEDPDATNEPPGATLPR